MDPPTQLELCGVARREAGQLVWASPLMQPGVESYFNSWTLGDAFACCNDWPKALECYRMAERDSQLWSASDSVRPRLSGAVKAFESRLFSLAGRPGEAVARLRESCLEFLPFLLGFEQVRWHVADPSGEVWRQIEVTPPIPSNVSPLIQPHSRTARLPIPNRQLKDIVELKSGLAVLEIVVPLPGSDGLAEECVLMSNYLSELPIAGDIRKAIQGVFDGGGDGLVRSGTSAIMSLQQDIVAYWPYLDEETREHVRQWFAVELDDQGQITRLGL